MKNTAIRATLLTTFTCLMAVTNPSKEAYVESLAWQFQDTTCKQEQLPVDVKATCYTLAPLALEATKSILNGYSRRQDYILFSIYTTDLWGIKNRKFGAFGNFL
jgi:hypothetical protein